MPCNFGYIMPEVWGHSASSKERKGNKIYYIGFIIESFLVQRGPVEFLITSDTLQYRFGSCASCTNPHR